MVRPVRPPRGGRSALSWDCAALRGHRPDVASADMGSASARAAFRRPPGTRDTGPAEPACAGRRPPVCFRFPSEVHRSTPAPSRGSEDPLVGRCFLPWALAPHDASRTGGPVARGASGHAACRVRGLGTPIAASTTDPAGALRHPSVHRLRPSRRSPRGERTPSRGPRPSWRCPRRFARPPGERADAAVFRASIPSRARAAAGPLRDRRVDAFLGFAPPERSFPPSCRARFVGARSPITRWAV